MEFSEQVLVLQVGRFKEADLWVRFLSSNHGVLSAFAFGGSRSRKRFVGCLDTFNEVLFRVKGSTRNAYLSLEEGTLIKGLDRLRHDWRRFGIAQNCAKFLMAFGVHREGASEAHFLFTELLGLLEKAEQLPGLLPLLFRARLAFDQGYRLNTDNCSGCNAPLDEEGGRLAVRLGQIFCRKCGPSHAADALDLSRESLAVFSGVEKSGPCEWTNLCLPPVVGKECARAIDGFIQYHVGLVWENGRFVRA